MCFCHAQVRVLKPTQACDHVSTGFSLHMLHNTQGRRLGHRQRTSANRNPTAHHFMSGGGVQERQAAQ